MRFSLVLTAAGFVLCSFTGGALAQQSSSTGAPLYVPQSGGTAYYPGASGSPVYNNAAQPFAMDQMVAGQNAPSYNYNNQAKPYNLAPTSYNNGTLTGDQIQQMRADRDSRAQQYQSEYLQRLADRDAALGAQGVQGTVQGAVQGAQGYYNNMMPGQQPPAKAKKKRLVYRQDSGLTNTPPRLFNPDQ